MVLCIEVSIGVFFPMHFKMILFDVGYNFMTFVSMLTCIGIHAFIQSFQEIDCGKLHKYPPQFVLDISVIPFIV